MSEYVHVEKPFLEQLAGLGWQAIDQGVGIIPSDPAQSLRTSFRDWLLPDQRRTADIVIERNGLISVRVPKHLSEEQANAVVEHKRLWIYRSLAEWRDLNAVRVVREWVNGEGFLYPGCAYRLLLTQKQDEPLKLKDGRFCLQRKIVEAGGESAAKLVFEKFYAEKALKRITNRVAYFAPKVGVNPVSADVREIGYRWATCTQDGRLSFHWKCMMASPKVIDYIVVHELFTPMHFGMKWTK